MRLLDELEGRIRRSPRWVQSIAAPLAALMAVVGVAGMVMLVWVVVVIVVIAVALTAGQFAERRAAESRSRSANVGIFDDRRGLTGEEYVRFRRAGDGSPPCSLHVASAFAPRGTSVPRSPRTG